MTRTTRCLIALALLALMFVSGIALLQTGVYGLTVFMVYPVLLGGLASWALQSPNGRTAVWHGFLAVFGASCLLFIVGKEGGICVVMSLPLTLPLGALGGWLVYRFSSSRMAARGGVAMLLLMPSASLTFDTRAAPAVYTVRTSMTIAASPEQVWRNMVAIPELPAPHEWYFRAGIAYPKLARLEGQGGVGANRTCDFSTGQVAESIDAWDPPRLLRFRVLTNPAPMREWTPYGEISPKHLQGYFISREGEFRLTSLAGNRTLLEGTSWYSHGLWPAPYWRLLSDAVIHRIHRRVFQQIKTLAEADARP